MISRRLVVNLIVFFVVSFALVAYGIVNLLGNPLESPTMLTTEFANASGLYPGFEVELNGVPVGTVSSTALTTSATKVTMSIDPGIGVPRDVRSSVQIANDLGEQVVNLVPSHGGTVPDLTSGANVPAAANQVPADVGAVVATATRLLQAIPANDLNKLIGELATSLAGRAGDLRTLVSAGTTFSKEFVAYEQQFTELLANAPPALDAVTAVAPQLRQDLANTAALVQVLAEQKSGLHDLFTSGSSAFSEVDNLLTSQSANLGCVLHDTADILSNIAQPTNLSNLSEGLAANQYFFGAVDNIAVPGLAKATTTGAADNPNQIFLRTRLFLPPILSEPGASYPKANPIPDTLPGAGCVTVFGNGVGPASQPGFTPAAGGHVVAPTAQEADVELGTGTPVPVSNASYRVPGASRGALLTLGGLVVPALFLAWGRAPRAGARDAGPDRCPGSVPGNDPHGGRQTDMTTTEHTVDMDSGVKVVGATAPERPGPADGGPPRPPGRRRTGGRTDPGRRALRVVSVLAALGLLGTLTFGMLYATKSSGGLVQDPAVLNASKAFLTDFFNFDAKTVDADFTAVTNMATGAFSTQAREFFNTSIRTSLEQALAESRGEIRLVEVQSENQGAGTASVYAVVDQTYVNNKITSPQADVVRLVADLQRVGGVWKISDVTVLEGATPAGAGSASGSAGSSVPGQ